MSLPRGLEHLYEGQSALDVEIYAPIRKYFRPPARFDHGGWHLVAELPKEGGDGQPARIYEARMPARFFKVEVLAGPDSMGEQKKGFALSTGSGDAMGALCVQIALAASQGMIGFHEGDA